MAAHNHAGFELFVPITPPYEQDGHTVYDIRQTMVDVLCINYPHTCATTTYLKHIPVIRDADNKHTILTGGNLRQWLSDIQNRYAHSFPNVLKCLKQVDPINDPNTQKIFKNCLAEDQKRSHTKSAKEFLESEITQFNFSSTLLASQIRKVIKKEIGLYSDMIQSIATDRDLEYDGIGLFYGMKDLILQASKSIAQSYDTQIRALQMEFVSGYPRWMEYVDDMLRLRLTLDNLQFYIEDHILHDQFMSLFYKVMHANLGEKALADNLYQHFYYDHKYPTWVDLLKLISDTKRHTYLMDRTKVIRAEEETRRTERILALNVQYPRPAPEIDKDMKWSDTEGCPFHNK